LWLQNICNFFEFFQSFFFFQFTLLGPPGAGNCTWGRVPWTTNLREFLLRMLQEA
jgi:hypothetical protein